MWKRLCAAMVMVLSLATGWTGSGSGGAVLEAHHTCATPNGFTRDSAVCHKPSCPLGHTAVRDSDYRWYCARTAAPPTTNPGGGSGEPDDPPHCAPTWYCDDDGDPIFNAFMGGLDRSDWSWWEVLLWSSER